MKLKNKSILLLSSIVCVILVLIIFVQFQSSTNEYATVIFNTNQGEVQFFCMIADDNQSRMKGLLDCTELDKNKGMLFVYSTPQPRVFTMKDMKIPLDIIFINSNKTVGHIVEADIGQRYIHSKGPVQYVVEINQGLTEKHAINIGTPVHIIYPNT